MIKTKVIKKPNFAALALMNLDLSRELNDAGALVKTDIQDRYKNNIDLEGNATTPLKASTIERKSKDKRKKVSDNASKPLVATENMQYNEKIDKATPKNQTVTISIGPTRDEIYGYHHEGNENLPQRQKFGIGKGVDAKIDEFVIRRIDRLLANIGNGP